MWNIAIGAVVTAHEAFMNWILPYAAIGGIAFGLLVSATVTLFVFAFRKQNGAERIHAI